ncbi:hypothetical protein ACFVS2_25525 [Brevibacillus sp. NPDC058079]|uniref:hypothetical protein n=1 Tax=Brevibacillus sp. NPDC058079 TaxID=3346330 RepID=UPI0036EA35D8
MTNLEKIELLNSIHKKIRDWDCDGDTCYNVMIRVDEESRRVLNKLGVNDQYIQLNQTQGENDSNELNIAPIGFGICEASWWDPFMGFMDERP